MRTAHPILALLALSLAIGCAPVGGAPDIDPDAGPDDAPDGALDATPEDALPDGAAPETPDAAEPDTPDAAPDPHVIDGEAIDWMPCNGLAGQADARATCARLELPLRRDRADTQYIDGFVKRVRGAEPDGRSLWILTGGPGQAGDAAEPLARLFVDAEPGLTVYLPDHRGTGRSTRLTCADAEALDSPGGAFIAPEEWPGCFDTLVDRYGVDGLGGFSTTEAARDLVALIDAVGDPEPFVLGISYGTYLAHRYAHIAPEQAAGIIFDSACAPGHCFLSEQDQWEDRVGRQWLDEVCAADATCVERLGPEPSAALANLHAALADGHCPSLTGDPITAQAATRSITAQMLLSAGLRSALPALIHRIARCEPRDMAAIGHLAQNVFGGGGVPGTYSFPLGINIAAAELWERPSPTVADIEARYEATIMCRGVSRQSAPQVEAWTPYADPLVGAVPDRVGPTLILQAEYDPATPIEIASPLFETFDGPGQHTVIVPHASHTVVAQSAMAANPQGPTCGFQLVRSFLADPEAAPDMACVDATQPPLFVGAPGYNQAVFGTADLWD